MGVFTGPATSVTAGQTSGVAAAINTAVSGVNAFGATTSYTPSWTAATTNPVIGNGSIIGLYSQINKMVYFKVVITFGTTTTFGTGAYSLTLPVAAAGTGRLMFLTSLFNGGVLYMLETHLAANGVNNTAIIYYISNGTTSSVSSWTSAAPVALVAAATNQVCVHGWYESV